MLKIKKLDTYTVLMYTIHRQRVSPEKQKGGMRMLMKRTNIYLPESLSKKLDDEAAEDQVTKSEVIRRILISYYNEKDVKNEQEKK